MALEQAGTLLSDGPRPHVPDRSRDRQLLDRFKDFDQAVTDFIESVPEEEIGRTDIRDLDPLERIVEGRIALVGDAAHATTPNLGRGAGEALEDAVALAEHLSAARSLEDSESVREALKRYEAQRLPLVASVQRRTRRVGEVFAFSDPVRVAIREQLMRHLLGPRLVKATEDEFRALSEQPVPVVV